MGISSLIYFSDYIISTDRNILFFEDIHEDKGFINDKAGSNHPYTIVQETQPLARVFIGQSPDSLVYKR